MIPGKVDNLKKSGSLKLTNGNGSQSDLAALLKTNVYNLHEQVFSLDAKTNRISSRMPIVIFPTMSDFNRVLNNPFTVVKILLLFWTSKLTLDLAKILSEIISLLKPLLARLKMNKRVVYVLNDDIINRMLIKYSISLLNGPELFILPTELKESDFVLERNSIVGKNFLNEPEEFTSFLLLFNLKTKLKDSVTSIQGAIALNGLNFLQLSSALPKESVEFSNVYFKSVMQSSQLQNVLFHSHGSSKAETLEVEKWVRRYGKYNKRFFTDFAFFFTQLFDKEVDDEMVGKANGSKEAHEEEELSNSRSFENDISEEKVKKHFFTEELKIFCFEEAFRVEVTNVWRDRCLFHLSDVLEKLKMLTANKLQRNKAFLTINSRLIQNSRFGSFSFSLKNKYDRAAAMEAMQHSELNLSKFKPIYVPKFTSEEEFFKNYFSHVLQLRLDLGSVKRKLVVVASKNPCKLKATKSAFESMFTETAVEGMMFDMRKSESGVSAQPTSETETKLGAKNRCDFCFETKDDFEDIDYIVGIEGGVQTVEDEHWCVGWVCILKISKKQESSTEYNKEYSFARSTTFRLPTNVSNLLKLKVELGPGKLFFNYHYFSNRQNI